MFIRHEPERNDLRRRVMLPLLLALLAFSFTALGGPGLFRAAAEEDQPLIRANPPDDRVALTFDVTWGQEELAKILTELEAHQVKATFFVGGTFLGLHGDTVKQLAARGHEVGTLGQRIMDLSALPEQEVTSNLLASQSTLSQTLGAPVRYFRPPLGPAAPSVVRGARSAQLITVTFSLDGEDQFGRSSAEIARRIVRSAQRGDIIRLTASDWSRETVKALPEVLRGLKAKGFKPVPVSALMPQEG